MCKGLFSHFNRHNWRDRIRIMDKHPNPLPRCEKCGIPVPEGRLKHLPLRVREM